jgi:hypothetical protein
MVFNANFNNSSTISWLSFLLVEETRCPAENHRLHQITIKGVASRTEPMMVEPMQSEPITTDVVVSNIDQVYSIM